MKPSHVAIQAAILLKNGEINLTIKNQAVNTKTRLLIAVVSILSSSFVISNNYTKLFSDFGTKAQR
jgi:uncharacterized protein YigE (DUF2233 family)